MDLYSLYYCLFFVVSLCLSCCRLTFVFHSPPAPSSFVVIIIRMEATGDTQKRKSMKNERIQILHREVESS